LATHQKVQAAKRQETKLLHPDEFPDDSRVIGG